MALSKIVENSIADEAVSSAKLKDFSAAVDLNGVELILDADQDTSITADTDDRIDFKIANTDHISFGTSSGDTVIKAMVDAKDILFQQFDGRTLLDINDGGFVGIANGATGPGELRIFEDTDNGSNYVGLSAGSISSSFTLTLPTADGSSGQFLKTDGSGALSFDTVSSAADDLTAGDAAVTLTTTAGNITIDAQGDDTDIIFKGTDGGSDKVFMTIDGSAGGDLFLTGGLIDLKNDGSAVSQIKFYCESNNAHAQTLIGAPHSESASNTLTLPSTGGDAKLVSVSSTATLTNKSIDSDNNTITNIVNADIKSSAAIADTKLDTISTAGKVALSALDIDGGTDIGAAIADADLFVIDDGAGGTNRKVAASRIKTYAGFSVADITGATALGAEPADTDELIISDAGTLKRVDYSYIKPDTYIHYQNVRTSAVSAGDAYIQLTSLFDSTYAVYKMFLYNINMSADSKIRLQLVTGSSTLEGDSGDYKYAGNGKNSDGQGSDWSSNSSTLIELTGETLRQDAGMIGGIEVTIYDPADTNLRTRVVMQGGATRTGNYTYSAFGTAETTFTTAVTGVRVSAETGNFDSLKVKVFGIV